MKKGFSILLFFTVIFVLPFGFSACNDDSNNNDYLTSVGLPTSFTYQNGVVDVYSYVNGNKLSKIVYGNLGESITFTYDGADLVKCSCTHRAGIGGIDNIYFTKDGSAKVLVKITFTGSANSVTDTIEIGSKGYPNVIKKGARARVNDIEYRQEHRYVLDESGSKVAEKLYFYIDGSNSSLLRARKIYEYDNHPGTTSLLDCPKWFSVYFYENVSMSISDKQLFNSVNNLTKQSVYEGLNPVPSVLNEAYTYGGNGFPISVLDGNLGEKITIKY